MYCSSALCIFCVLLTTYTVEVSHPVLFVIVLCLLLFYVYYCLCLLWSVKGLQMQISCVATIWSRASNGDIYVLTVDFK